VSAISFLDAAAVQDRLGGLAAQIRAGLGPALEAGAAAIADRAGGLAGGRLGGSITVELGDDGVAVGSDLPYARLRELGFQGSESVKAYLREIRQVFGRPVTPHPIAVRPFTRNVDVPARPYLAPALEAAGQDLSDAVAAALTGALQS